MNSNELLRGFYFDPSKDSNAKDLVEEISVGYDPAKVEAFIAQQKSLLSNQGVGSGTSAGTSSQSNNQSAQPTAEQQQYTARLAGYSLTMAGTNWLLLLIAFLLFLILIFNE